MSPNGMHIELWESAPARAPERAERARDATFLSDLTSTSCAPQLKVTHRPSPRSKSEPRRQRSMSPSRDVIISVEEFEALPASIQ